jgi:hypothetical protein
METSIPYSFDYMTFYRAVNAAIHYDGPDFVNCSKRKTFKFSQLDESCKKQRICKKDATNLFSQPISVGEFWKYVPKECEIEPTIIPPNRLHLFWYYAAYVWGSHHPNQWMERKEVLKLGMGKDHSMRGAFIPRPSTVLPFYVPIQDQTRDPIPNSLIMMKYGNSHYFMVWQPFHGTCTNNVYHCPNLNNCPNLKKLNDFSLF